MDPKRPSFEEWPEQAVLLRAREAMGVVDQRVLEDGSVRSFSPGLPPNSYSFAMPPVPAAREDVHDADQLILSFDGRLLKLPGKLLVRLAVDDTVTRQEMPGEMKQRLQVHDVRLQTVEGNITVQLSLHREFAAQCSWGYSRHAGLRTSCQLAFDQDEIVTKSRYHATWLAGSTIITPRESGPGLHEIALPLKDHELRYLTAIDRCEAFLDRLDRQFTAGSKFLQWEAKPISQVNLERAVFSMNERGVNVIWRQAGSEWIVGQRIRPLIEFSVTLMEAGSAVGCASIGIAVDM